jgi:folate-binding protein YgfZ
MKTCADLLGPDLAAVSARFDAAPFSVVVVRGPDARGFLHRLCSQDVLGLAPGEARPAAFLTAKGKLESLVWIGGLPDGVCVETQAHERDKVAALLERYHFAERLAIDSPQAWECRMVFGPRSWDALSAGARSCHADGATFAFAGDCRGLRWARWHGAAADLPDPGFPRAVEADWHLRRIAAGMPWMGIDADATTLAPEAGIDDHLDRDKGCYTGQEIVARIDTYGHVNRQLRRLRIGGAGAIQRGTVIEDADGAPVGRVLSTAEVPGAGERLALGYLPRELCTGDTALQLAAPLRSTVRLAD